MNRCLFLLALAGVFSACAGSWAQDTHVSLASIAPSHVHGDAEVAQATVCKPRCTPTEGSQILLTLEGGNVSSSYEVVLAEGSCPHFRGPQTVIASGSGHDLEKTGARAWVSIPIHPLTQGNYILFARDTSHKRVAACGRIRADAIY